MCFYWCAILRQNLRLKLYLFLRCLMPGNLFQINCCIIDFSVIKLCLSDCTIKCHFPTLIRSNDFFCSIFICNTKLAQKSLAVNIITVYSLISKGSDCPASSNYSNQLIFLLKLCCYIICLILKLISIRCESRCKINISYFLTV